MNRTVPCRTVTGGSHNVRTRVAGPTPPIVDPDDSRAAVVVVAEDEVVADAIAILITRQVSSVVLTARSVRSVMVCDVGPAIAVLRSNLPDGSDLATNASIFAAAGWGVIALGHVDTHHATDQRSFSDVRFVSPEAGAGALLDELRAMSPRTRVLATDLPSHAGRATASTVLLSTQEHRILAGYVRGLTLHSAARAAGVKPGTAKKYLERVKAKYSAAGRPARTKLELARRAQEDGLLPGDDVTTPR